MFRAPNPFFVLFPVILTAAFCTGDASAREGTVTVTIPTGSYEIGQTAGGHTVKAEGFGRCLVAGKPDLPAKIFAIAIPPGATVAGVTFDAGETITLPGVYRVRPCALPRVMGEEDPLLYKRDLETYEANHESVYGSDDPYPSRIVEFVGRAGYRKYNLADVRVAPFVYNPASGRLAYHPEITLHVHYDLPDLIPAESIVHDDVPATERRARRIVYNYDQAQAWHSPTPASRGRDTNDFVILTPSHLTDAVQPIVDWETAKGRQVRVVTTSYISYHSTGYDFAEKIRNFLRDHFPSSSWGIRDLLIVGHYDDVPIRRVFQDVGYGMPETDFYYSELSYPDNQSWDIDQNRCWGEDTDPNDFYGEVIVGRIPWSDPDIVEAICKKTVAFELNCDPAYKRNALLLGAYFWADTDSAVLMEMKADPLWNSWMADWTTKRLYEQNNDYYSYYPCDMDLNEQNAVTSWSQGRYAFANLAGHGSPYSCHILGMGAPPFVQNASCGALNNDFPSVVFANACSTSDTDYDNLGRQMLKDGAVGFLGATKVSFGVYGWCDPYHGCGSSMDYFFTTLFTAGNNTQGEALALTIDFMYQNNLFYFVKYELFEWASIWGSPSVSLAPQGALTIVEPADRPEGTHPPGLESPMTLKIVSGNETYVPGTGLLHYRFDPNDPFAQAALTGTGDDYYEVVLPATGGGDLPEFYFSADGDGGTTVFLPADAPNEVYSFRVALTDVIMKDDFEDDTGWTTVDENIENGEWERADPDWTGAQPEDDHSEVGSLCFVTGKEGVSAGFDDLDGGPTRLISPDLDLSDGDAELAFYLWFYHTDYGIQQPLEIHLSNDSGTTWTKAIDVTHHAGWKLTALTVSEYVTPTANVRIRLSAVDNPNDDVVEALIDDFMILRYNDDPTLWADRYTLPAAEGGRVNFSIEAGVDNGGRVYYLLGSTSGTSPGTVLSDGTVLPLNWDSFTDSVWQNMNNDMFLKFNDYLDGDGSATATFDTLGAIDPSMIGKKVSFAYAVGPEPWFTSNPITLDLLPCEHVDKVIPE